MAEGRLVPDLLSHFEAVSRPPRGSQACGCCEGKGFHSDGSPCSRCDSEGHVPARSKEPYCPGQRQPRRRHWHEAAMPRPDYDPAEELPQGRGIWYRAHLRNEPFDAQHARSSDAAYTEPGDLTSSQRTGQRGYSAFASPHHLSQYMDERAWLGDRRARIGSRDVLAFHGKEVGRGADNEPLVIPEANPHCCGNVVHSRMSWGDFERKIWDENTPEHIPEKPWDTRVVDQAQKSVERHRRRHGREASSLPDLHRGISVPVASEDHDIISDRSRPVHERAQHLLDTVTREGLEPLGQHWTSDEEMGRFFTQYNSPHAQDYQVVFHARHPGQDAVINDPGWREEHEVNDSEDEHPVERKTDMEVHGISWRRKGTDDDWTTHQFAEPQWHSASLASGGQSRPEQRHWRKASVNYSHFEEDPGRHVIDAHDETGRNVGYATVEEHPDHAFIDEVYVHPDARGQGIARGLMQNTLSQFPGRTLRLKPDPYESEDQPGEGLGAQHLRRFYRSFGFEDEGNHMVRHAGRQVAGRQSVEYGRRPQRDWKHLTDLREQGREEEASTLGDQWRNDDNEWKRNIRRGLSLGHLTQDEAEEHGYYGSGHDARDTYSHSQRRTGWQPLPQESYHVTTNLPGVRAYGLKSRAELAQHHGGAGLGGGDDESISLTTDHELAGHILNSLHEYHSVLNDPHSSRRIWEEAKAGRGASRPFHAPMARYYNSEWKDGDPLPHALSDVIEGRERHHGLPVTHQEMTAGHGPGWEPADDGWKSKNGDPVHMEWHRPASGEHRMHQRSELYKSYSYWRSDAGGPPDPMFFSNDERGFAAMNPRHFALLHVRPQPGAQGYPLSGMSEWRTHSGDALHVHHYEQLGDSCHMHEAGNKAGAGGLLSCDGVRPLGTDNEGHQVELDPSDGWQHLDGSVSHEDGTSVTDHPVRDSMGQRVVFEPVKAAWTPHARIFGPTFGLDKDLFDGDALKPLVRTTLLSRLAEVLAPLLGPAWEQFSSVHLAGSEASKWTSKDCTGNGDLDTLIGVAYSYARDHTPALAHLSDAEIDRLLNGKLQEGYNISHWRPDFAPGREFDLTGYVNHSALDIKKINPYAAYDLLKNTWTVKPPDLPDWGPDKFPQGKAIFAEARALIAQIRAVLRLPEPFRTQEVTDLYDYIHTKRARDFAEDGLGWQGAGNILEKAVDQASGNLIGKLKAIRYHQKDASTAPVALGQGMTAADLAVAHG